MKMKIVDDLVFSGARVQQHDTDFTDPCGMDYTDQEREASAISTGIPPSHRRESVQSPCDPYRVLSLL